MDFQWRGVPPSWNPVRSPDLMFKFGPTLFVARSSALVCRLLWKSIGSTSPHWRTVSKCLEASSQIDPYCTAKKAARAFALLQKRQAHMGDAVPRVQPNDNPTCIFVCQRLRSVCTCRRPFASQLFYEPPPEALSTGSVNAAWLAGGFGQTVVMSWLLLPDPVARFTGLRVYRLSVFFVASQI